MERWLNFGGKLHMCYNKEGHSIQRKVSRNESTSKNGKGFRLAQRERFKLTAVSLQTWILFSNVFYIFNDRSWTILYKKYPHLPLFVQKGLSLLQLASNKIAGGWQLFILIQLHKYIKCLCNSYHSLMSKK